MPFLRGPLAPPGRGETTTGLRFQMTLKVLHYSSTFSPLTETYPYNVISSSPSESVDAVVATHERVREDERPFDPVYEVGVPSWWELGRKLEVAWRRVFDTLGFRIAHGNVRKRIRRVVEEVDPDLLHAHYGLDGLTVLPLAERHSLPLIVSFYGNDVGSVPRLRGFKSAYRRMMAEIDLGIALSEVMKSQLVELGLPEERCEIIRLGLDLDRFEYREPEGEPRTLLTVGRLTPKKGHESLLKAVSRLTADGHDLRLRIVGDGPLRGRLEDMAEAEGWNWAEFVGSVKHEQAIEEMTRADLFALCSQTAPDGDMEGTPTVLLEAQATGLPCVSTEHAGIPEIIPEENHWLLAEPGNEASVIEVLKQVLEADPEERVAVSRRGKRFVERKHDIERNAEKLRTLYRAVL